MTVRELRSKYLAFFQSKGHRLHPSGSLIPYWVTGQLDESLLFNGAGMIQFKPYFRGVAQPESKRLTTCQKCVRTGDIEEVGDDGHLTFFEMLGNFSFGDYFKAEAIDFSWEFLTSPEWLALDPERLAFTVFEQDDEAFEHWSGHLRSAGIDPQSRIFRLGEETNYWPAGSFSSGPPGPCGPNSEMFYWTGDTPPTGPYTREDFLRDDSSGLWLEIWNDVFITYEWQGRPKDPARPDLGWEKTGLPELPFRSIDTGMGLERTAAVLAGLKSVYDTDAFQPILRELDRLGAGRFAASEPRFVAACRIVADHIRTSVFCMADGILPGNAGRGYVLRRLIRRAVLKGSRELGFAEPFLHRLAPTVIAGFEGFYPELEDRRELILERLLSEEELFRRTLETGVGVFAEVASSAGAQISGERAFFLYDTYGFPLEITRELAAERGQSVDEEGFRAAMLEAQERSRAASTGDDVYGAVKAGALAGASPTEFIGYRESAGAVRVAGVQTEADRALVALDRSPFYAESGGQVGDAGLITGDGWQLEVLDTRKENGVWIHSGRLVGSAPEVGAAARAEVDPVRRAAIVRHHTATHLLHAALREVLGGHVAQAGSLVAPDQLRFDFSHGSAMTSDEIARVERIVNEMVLAGEPVVVHEDLPLAEARAMGAMALFGEKYGDRVRVVQIGDMAPDAPSFSRELCGGIHVRNTGQIGLFKITGESSAAAGVRRITAVAGAAAQAWVQERIDALAEAGRRLKSAPLEVPAAIDRLAEALKEERRRREKLAASGGAEAVEYRSIGPVRLVVQDLADMDPGDAQKRADALVDPHPDAVAVLAARGGKSVFVVKAGPAAVAAGVHAGNLARELAKLTGGGGGGRPNFATAGIGDASKTPQALAAAADLVSAQLG
ncbi:MAG: alanine--tRNA ligase [Fimbriimonadaceae bacterium]|nr:alanine--tRNA ligase [Fimbriimonadaceae bacterium]